ncbi:hypothetical protein GCM10018966_091830 [Streptomyces yanii]
MRCIARRRIALVPDVLGGAELSVESGDAFATKLNWDPRGRTSWVYLRFTPYAVRAWREVNELAERELMAEGTWLI